MIYKCFRPLLFQLDPETAHYVTLNTLKSFFRPWMIKLYLRNFPQKPTSVFGLKFPNPVGLAAGLDKNGDYIDPLLGLGFGFVEIGAITPKSQSGNPRPRLFRLPQAKALINRFGFNNAGVDYFVQQIQKRKVKGIVGVNIGKNLSTSLDNAYEDYKYCFEKTYPYVDYVAINISSPNTPDLRELQSEKYLGKVLSKLKEEQRRLEDYHQRHVPLLFKISPDLTQKQLEILAQLSLKHSLEGLIATNTTNSREGVENLSEANEKGGLSGKPLFPKTLTVIKELNKLVQDVIPIIAVGGIFLPRDVQAFLSAGASLVQVYTGLIYQGPMIIKKIINELKEEAETIPRIKK